MQTNHLLMEVVSYALLYAKCKEIIGGDVKLCTHSASQHTQSSLMNIHDGVVLPFVAVHFLQINYMNTLNKHDNNNY